MKKVIIFIVVAVILYGAWQMFFPHRYHTTEPLSLHEARSASSFSLPDDASEIYLANYNHWISYSRYLRFHAPTKTCATYLNTVISGIKSNAKQPVTQITTNIISPASRIDRRPDVHICPFADGLPWFDVDTITNGMMVDIETFPHPTIYVDTDRELFYYLETD